MRGWDAVLCKKLPTKRRADGETEREQKWSGGSSNGCGDGLRERESARRLARRQGSGGCSSRARVSSRSELSLLVVDARQAASC